VGGGAANTTGDSKFTEFFWETKFLDSVETGNWDPIENGTAGNEVTESGEQKLGVNSGEEAETEAGSGAFN
jgi:hypothetical protein